MARGFGSPGLILHVKLFNPVNDHYGLSPIEAAATAIDIHNTASKWNKALLDNSAHPSGALVYTSREGNLSPEQFERLKAELEQGFVDAEHRSAMTPPPTPAARCCSKAASTGGPAPAKAGVHEPHTEGHGLHRSQARRLSSRPST